MAALALAGARVFDGTRLVDGHAVVVAGPRIVAVVPERDLAGGLATRRVDGLIAPGFIDTQVNGGGGVLFNDRRTVEGIAAIGAAHRRFGTTGFLPTLITDSRAHMAEAVAAAGAAIRAGVPGILGIHLEGPFLNPERKGVHDPALMRPIEEEDIAIVSSLGVGRTLVTLAPEKVPLAVIARLVKAGLILSAGHTAADYDT
ncbi:MAG: amidohydrolase family protein, partial [Bauldia sp.]|nr:amidohydrolase family protein [Bauldia sp.]